MARQVDCLGIRARRILLYRLAAPASLASGMQAAPRRSFY